MEESSDENFVACSNGKDTGSIIEERNIFDAEVFTYFKSRLIDAEAGIGSRQVECLSACV